MGKKADALRIEIEQLKRDLESKDQTIIMLQKDMPVGEYLMRIALNQFWGALGAEHQTDACQKLRGLVAERDQSVAAVVELRASIAELRRAFWEGPDLDRDKVIQAALRVVTRKVTA